MARIFLNPNIDKWGFIDTTRQAQAHLWRVYAVLAAGFAFAALGCFSSYTIHPFVINLGWIVSAIGLCVFYQNMYAASCFYLGFSSCTGGLVSAFFRYTAIPDDDKIVVQMLMQVAILFVVFSILAATTNRLAWLWLGGWGFSILANLLVAALAQAVFAISMSMSILLFIKNFLFGFYILYDTQRILESFYAGEENILVHVKMPFDGMREKRSSEYYLLTCIVFCRRIPTGLGFCQVLVHDFSPDSSNKIRTYHHQRVIAHKRIKKIYI